MKDNLVRLLIWGDNSVKNAAYEEIARKFSEIKLVAIVKKEKLIYAYLSEVRIDVLLISFASVNTGLTRVTEWLNRRSVSKPLILVSTGNDSEALLLRLSAYHAYARVNACRGVTDTVSSKSCQIRNEVTVLLAKLGFNKNHKGTSYLEDAVIYACLANTRQTFLMKGIYGIIAEQGQTSWRNVERAIRNSIESAWNRREAGDRLRVYTFPVNPDTGKPTNREFIFNMTEMVLKVKTK